MRLFAGADTAHPLMISGSVALPRQCTDGSTRRVLRHASPTISRMVVFAEFWLVGGPRPEYSVTPEYQILDYHLPTAATLASPATVTMRLTRSVLSPDETLEPAEGTWQLLVSDPPSGHEGPLGKVKNYQSVPITVVIMTAAFQEAAATPTVATPTS